MCECKNASKEADIVADAGNASSVTIATNMAGRGTDIKLTDEVKKAGGLAIIGTERHDSRRVDRQLKRKIRKTRETLVPHSFMSFEDKLIMRLFGSGKNCKINGQNGA